MKQVTIDDVLREYYHAISSDKLSDENITIDEDLFIEDSKNKYLQEFATFLNVAYHNNYKVSESIISKFMNVIEYTGYECQIIRQYVKVFDDFFSDLTRPNICILSPYKAIEYINLYLNAKDHRIPYYGLSDNFRTNDHELIDLIEIENPSKIIKEDMLKWIEENCN